MKLKIRDKNQVWVKIPGKPDQHVVDKVEGFAIRRRSRFSFFYKDKLYDMKGGFEKPAMSKAYKRYLDDKSR